MFFFSLTYFFLLIISNSSVDSDEKYIPAIIELKYKCAVEYYLEQKTSKSSNKELTKLTSAYIEELKSLQSQLIHSVNKEKNDSLIKIFSVQRVFNGIGCYISKNKLGEISKNELVKTIHPLGRFELHLSTSLPSLGIPTIWNDYLATGKNIRVAVIDTGVDYIHPDLGGSGSQEEYNKNNPTIIEEEVNYPNAKIIGGYDFVGEDYNPDIPDKRVPNPDPDPFDQLGHGTHVAGIIGGYGVLNDGSRYNGSYDSSTLNNSFSVPPGVAPEIQIYALKIFSTSPKSEILIPAIEWAIDPNQDGDFEDRVDIINLSLGEDFGFSDTPECIACENAFELGTLVIASAGNRGDSFYAIAMPASASSVIGVGAYEDPDPNIPSNTPYRMAYFSSRGPSISSSNNLILKPDISAPGIWILSANLGASPLEKISSGTSMSAPHISGIVGLMKEVSPELSPSELKAILINNAIYHTVLIKGDVTYSAGPTISGGGRLDLANNINLGIIAFNADKPEEVSLTFDLAEITEDTQVTKRLRVKNLTNVPQNFHIQTIPYVEPTGVTITPMEFEVGPIPQNQYIDIPITISAIYSQISNFNDPSIYVRSSEPKRAWVSEFYGKIFIQNVSNEIFLSVPFYAQVKPASKLELTPKEINLVENNTLTLKMSGIHLNTGTEYPVDLLSFYGIFEVIDVSEKVANLPNYLSCGDINYVAVADDYDYLQNGTPLEEAYIYFLISTYSPWSTLNTIKFKIYIDTDENEDTNFVISNSYTYESQPPPPSSAVFVSMLENNQTLERKILYPLYGYSADQYDMNVFRNNTIIIPIKASDIQLNEANSNFKFYCETILVKDIPILIDQAPSQTSGETKKKYFYDIKSKSFRITSPEKSKTIEPTINLNEISIYINPETYSNLNRKGLLCYFSHNPLADRIQFIPVILNQPEGEQIEGNEEGENYEGEILEGEGISEGESEEVEEGESPTEGDGCIEGIIEGEEGEVLPGGEGSPEGASEEENQENIEGEGEYPITISPPKNLNASNGMYEDFILLLWEPPDNCLYCEYEIFRGKTNKLENAEHIADSKLPFYFDYIPYHKLKKIFQGCINNRLDIYYYWVRAKLKISEDKFIYSDFSEPDAGWPQK